MDNPKYYQTPVFQGAGEYYAGEIMEGRDVAFINPKEVLSGLAGDILEIMTGTDLEVEEVAEGVLQHAAQCVEMSDLEKATVVELAKLRSGRV